MRNSKLWRVLVTALILTVCMVLLPGKAEAATVASGTCGANLTWTLDDQGTLTISGNGAMNDWYDYDSTPWYSRTSSIKAVVIENGVTTVGDYAFAMAFDTSSVQIADSVRFIGEYSFRSCDSLTAIELPQNLQLIKAKAFFSCDNLESIVIPASVSQIEQSVFYGCTSLKTVVLQEGLLSIGSYAFKSCANLRTITVPDSVLSIGDSVFSGCENLKTAELGEGITAMGYRVFEDCISLNAITIGSNIPEIDSSTFYNCAALTTVVIPESVTAIGSEAFAYCSSLSEITFKGNAPSISSLSFRSVRATVYYPAENTTWTSSKMQNYGGSLTWVAKDMSIQKFELSFARMILGNALEFQFAFPKSAADSWTGAYAVIVKDWADGSQTTKTVSASQWGTAAINGVSYWALVYDGLAAKEMADNFYVTIYNKEGKAISYVWTDSVRAYVTRSFSNQNAVAKTMMVDMLNYGAASQTEFSYNTDDLANKLLTSAEKAYATGTMNSISNNQVQAANYMGTRLVLESSIQMQVAFNNLTSDMYAVYSFTDHSGNSRNVTVSGENFVNAGGVQGIELSELVYADARKVVTIIVYNSNGTVHGMAVDSIESYAKRSYTAGGLFEYLMKFSDSANAYLHQ